ncbi:MAG: hotdog fold thioesterase [Cellvibrionaceae bacterium]
MNNKDVEKKSIWHTAFTLEELNSWSENTLSGFLGIEIIEIGDDFIKGIMPVSPKVLQPMGLVHGGANVAFAETLGSFCAGLVVDREKQFVVGQEINANHLRGVREGNVTGIAKAVYIGRTSHVWEIKLYDDREKLTCISRITMAILSR